jgi:hypothetical protein
VGLSAIEGGVQNVGKVLSVPGLILRWNSRSTWNLGIRNRIVVVVVVIVVVVVAVVVAATVAVVAAVAVVVVVVVVVLVVAMVEKGEEYALASFY